MSLTGITWLTGEIIDETRLNYMVGNSSYIKSLFTTGTSWGEEQINNLGWIDIESWQTDQIIDSYRLNSMYGNQNILRSLVGSGVTVWEDPTEYVHDQYYQNDLGVHLSPDPYLTINGYKFGDYLTINSKFTASDTNYAITNRDLSQFENYAILDVGLYFGIQGDENGMVSNKVKFVKLPEMRYLSYWITVGVKDLLPKYYRSNLLVIAHNDRISW